MSEANEAVVRRFYDELWNRWRLELAGEILSESLHFRGSLGATLTGRAAFVDYAQSIRAAFPDWHNRIDELIAIDDRVVTRMTWTGTQKGPFAGLEPCGARVEYAGAAFFRLAGGLIQEAWVVGDTEAFWRALRTD